MSDPLLGYYNDELDFIRRQGGEFAAAHEKIAARLRVDRETIDDPHVERLVQAFAYMNARIRHKLDDDFPELTDAMLGVLYPHYLAPMPSLAIVQMHPQPDLAGMYEVDRGEAIETDPVDGEPCRFTTCYPLELWPIEVAAAAVGRPAKAIGPRSVSSQVASVLRVELRCSAEQMTMGELAPDRLRFYLQGTNQLGYALHELLLNDTLMVTVEGLGEAAEPVLLGKHAVRPVGYERDEALLPYNAQAAPGYRLLTEYFAFPEKFLFIDIVGLSSALRGSNQNAGRSVQLCFHLRREDSYVERNVRPDSFALGCTPVVNLFERRGDPIALDHTVSEYPIIPDARRRRSLEVYSVDEVTASGPNGDSATYEPFYGISHGGKDDSHRTLWNAARRVAPASNPGSEVFLTLVDLNFKPSASADWVVRTKLTCLNRDLPGKLPFGGGQPRLHPVKGLNGVERMSCLTPPTATLRPEPGRGAMWKLVSHLSLNHLSVSDDEEGAKALREMLVLYDLRDSAQTRTMIDGLLGISSRNVAARVRRGQRTALAPGIETTLELDANAFTGSSAYLFGSVLSHFLGLHCAINAFSRSVVKIKGRDGALARFAPLTGTRALA